MATFKSIKNKYLDADDGEVLGVTTNTENISTLAFKLATADSLSKFNMVDGFSDAYVDASGIDASASTNESRDGTYKYYKGLEAVTTSGWDSQITDGLYTVEVFSDGGSAGTGNTEAATYVTDTAQSTEYLIVGGGGAGGGHGGAGGGGAGGVLTGTVSLAAGSFSITVGATSSVGWGGYGGQNSDNWKGNPSSFNDGTTTYTAGGGGGGVGGGQTIVNNPTASGGGGSGAGAPAGGTGGSQGGSGGSGYIPGPANTGGGGGGSSPAGGGSGSSSSGGSGGAGTSNSITGSAVYYAGGGGGGSHAPSGTYPGGAGGSGGGGAGAPRGTGTGSNATGYGSGGGGAGGTGGSQSGDGGRGSQGIVYLRHLTAGAPGAMTLISNSFTAQTAPTTARIILDEESYAGATTLNTDLRAYASRDGGTTYTQVTLADQGFLLGAGGINGDTECMLHMDGTDGGTTFTDSCTEGGNTAKTWTASGNAHTSTDQYKFGTASAQFDGTGDYINTPATSDWDFGSDNFTIDFWMRPGVVDSQQRLFGNLNSGGSSAQFEFILGGSNNMSFSGSLPSGLAVTNSATLAINTWYHIAVTRSGNDWRLFVNGTAGSTASFSGTMGANTTTSIGRSGEYNAQLYTGFIDEVRITPGVAIWTANFTPPVGPYQTSRRLLSGSVDISGQPSGTAMKYKITTHNQAAAKQTRVYGASLAWA